MASVPSCGNVDYGVFGFSGAQHASKLWFYRRWEMRLERAAAENVEAVSPQQRDRRKPSKAVAAMRFEMSRKVDAALRLYRRIQVEEARLEKMELDMTPEEVQQLHRRMGLWQP